MRKFVAVVAIALMVASCGSANTEAVNASDSTSVQTDSTAVVSDSTKVDSTITTK